MNIGRIYDVNHNRKGKFTGQLVSFDDTWATFNILNGTTSAILNYNIKHKGEEVTCRLSLCKISEVNK